MAVVELHAMPAYFLRKAMSTPRALGLALLLAGVSASSRAGAQDAPSNQAVDDSRRADAKARYERGVAAYTKGRYKDSVDEFLAADRLWPSAPL